MSRSRRLAALLFPALLLLGADRLGAGVLPADDPNLWREFGLLHTQTSRQGAIGFTAYEMKDLTGAVAAWEWQRTPAGKTCSLAAFCTAEPNATIVADDNYVVAFDSARVPKTTVDAVLAALPGKQDTSLPAILTFLPRTGLVPDSARYILGDASLKAFAPDLASSKPGFSEGAEAQVAEYHVDGSANPVHLALFYYPTPEMARLHSIHFRQLGGTFLKRSGVLDALVYGDATQAKADTLLSRVQYEAKITWNDSPPPPPIKPLYQLLLNIIYLSILLAGLCLTAGLIYGGMRIYRRRFGQLESQEAMTTLHLTRD